MGRRRSRGSGGTPCTLQARALLLPRAPSSGSRAPPTELVQPSVTSSRRARSDPPQGRAPTLGAMRWRREALRPAERGHAPLLASPRSRSCESRPKMEARERGQFSSFSRFAHVPGQRCHSSPVHPALRITPQALVARRGLRRFWDAACGLRCGTAGWLSTGSMRCILGQ